MLGGAVGAETKEEWGEWSPIAQMEQEERSIDFFRFYCPKILLILPTMLC